jgi:hypothetical protein
MTPELRGLTSERLQAWVSQGWLSSEQATRIGAELSRAAGADAPRGLSLLTVAAYLGAILVMSAMGWFLTMQLATADVLSIVSVGVAYAAIFSMGAWRLGSKSYRTASGLLWTCAVCMVPVLVHAMILSMWGFPDVRPSIYGESGDLEFLVLEVSTIAVGLVVLLRVRFSFLVFPIACAAWFLSQNLAAVAMGRHYIVIESHFQCNIYYGIFMIVVGYTVDSRAKDDFSFWLYLFGVSAFWTGVTMTDSDPAWGKVVYAGINLGLGFLGVYLRRHVFLVFSVLGIVLLIGDIWHDFFDNSGLLAVVLIALGFGIIVAALYLQRHRAAIDAALDRYRPARLRLR